MGVFSSCEGPAGPTGKPGLDGEDGTKGNDGPAGDKGEQGDKGIDGEKGDQGDGIKGEDGAKGPPGDVGTSFYITAELADEAALSEFTPPENLSDAYLIDGWLWVWDNSDAVKDWVKLYEIQGEKGPNGERGDTGADGSSDSGLELAKVHYVDDDTLSIGTAYDETLVKGGYARKPSADSVVKYLLDDPVPGLYQTSRGNNTGDIKNVRYDLKWMVGSSDVEWDFSQPVTASMTLTANWVAPQKIDLSDTAGDNVIAQAVAYILADTNQTDTRGNYTLLLDEDIALDATVMVSHQFRRLEIIGINDDPCEISLNAATGRIFSIAGTTNTTHDTWLTIQNITLQGMATNDGPLVYVTGGNNAYRPTFVMNDGATITGNTSNNNLLGGAAAVEVSGGFGIFTMNEGSKITGNTHTGTNSGNNIYNNIINLAGNTNSTYISTSSSYTVTASAIFTMNGGEISDNKVTASHGSIIFLTGIVPGSSPTPSLTATNPVSASFTMNGGTIKENEMFNGNAGMVKLQYQNSQFSMQGGSITNNTATGNNSGTGVYVSGGYFVMNNDASITGNKVNIVANATTSNVAAGVVVNSNSTNYIQNNGRFRMMGNSVVKDNVNILAGGATLVPDVYIDNAYTHNAGQALVLQGRASIGKLTLRADAAASTANNTLANNRSAISLGVSPLTAGGNYLGTIETLHLMGNNTNINTVGSYWFNSGTPAQSREIVRPLDGSGYRSPLVVADVNSRIRLGSFIGNTFNVSQTIETEAGLKWSTVAANIGKLSQ